MRVTTCFEGWSEDRRLIIRIATGVAILFLASLLGGCPLLYEVLDDDGKTSSGTVSVSTTSSSGELTFSLSKTSVTFSVEAELKTGSCGADGDLCNRVWTCVLYKSPTDPVAKKQYVSLWFTRDDLSSEWREMVTLRQFATCM